MTMEGYCAVKCKWCWVICSRRTINNHYFSNSISLSLSPHLSLYLSVSLRPTLSFFSPFSLTRSSPPSMCIFLCNQWPVVSVVFNSHGCVWARSAITETDKQASKWLPWHSSYLSVSRRETATGELSASYSAHIPSKTCVNSSSFTTQAAAIDRALYGMGLCIRLGICLLSWCLIGQIM